MAWHRWREPLAVLLLVALALMLAIRGIALGQAIEVGAMHGALGGIPGGDELLLLATAGAVLWCATPVPARAGEPAAMSTHARPIAIVGLLVIGLTVLGWFALSVWAVVELAQWPTPDAGSVLFVIEGVVRLVVPAVALTMAVLATGRTGAAQAWRTGSVRELPPATPALSEGSVDAETPTPARTEPERLPAAWHVDDAAGAVWLTADDAAQGRPGLSWAPSPATIPPVPGHADVGHVDTDDAAPEVADTGAEAADAGFAPQPRIRSSAEDDDLR